MRLPQLRTVALLILCLASLAPAAVTGKLASIGFGSFIRADCWIPITVQTSSDLNEPHTFDLQIVQSDLDGDSVVYTRPVTVNPGTQTFWACFKPDPINDGIPAVGTQNAPDLAKRLKIYLSEPSADPAQDRHVVQIATAGNLPQALERGNFESTRGQKLILVVGRAPNTREYSTTPPRQVIGLAEDVFFERVEPQSLPFDALGYDAIDAIVWTDADLERLDPAQLRAIRQYVRGGGRLVVVQNVETQRMGRLDEFLPVHVDSIAELKSSEPLHSILMQRGQPLPYDTFGNRVDPWERHAPPAMAAARATLNGGAIVDTWMTWPDGAATPYIARRLFGNGCVSWIAQDITDPTVRDYAFGWPRLWERLMDWHNNDLGQPLRFTAAMTKNEIDRANDQYDDTVAKDAGFEFSRNIDLPGKTAALISLAFIFFIGYWCVAGPGSYFLLAAQKRATWSWFVFGGIALLATALTVVLTQLVVRGAPEIRHLSMARIRGDASEPAYVRSHFGVYVKQDARVPISLGQRDVTAIPSAITPLVIDPRYTPDTVNARDATYAVNVEADDAGPTTEITVPFRSTLKKLEARWAGNPEGRISGQPRLTTKDIPIAGQLSNNTGKTLTDVILVFRQPRGDRIIDAVLALPEWKNGLTIDLAKEWDNASFKPSTLGSGRAGIQTARLEKPLRGTLSDAGNWLFEGIRRSSLTGAGESYRVEDAGANYFRSFPIVSLFDRFQPMTNAGAEEHSRVEILRHGVRQWDCSAALAGGGMVVLGQSEGPIPIPLTIDGIAPQGGGRILFQCVLPVDNSAVTQSPASSAAPSADSPEKGQP